MSERYPCRCCGNLTLERPPPGTLDICPVCFWEDGLAYFDTGGGAIDVTLREAQRSFEREGACSPLYVNDVRAPLPHEARRSNWRSLDQIRQDVGSRILDRFNAGFAGIPRPGHFTNYAHCEECAEFNRFFQSFDQRSMTLEQFEATDCNWESICFLTPEGFRYWLPVFVRMGVSDHPKADYFLERLITFHLIDPSDHQLSMLNEQQVRLIAHLTEAIVIDLLPIFDDVGQELPAVAKKWRQFAEEFETTGKMTLISDQRGAQNQQRLSRRHGWARYRQNKNNDLDA